MFTTDGRGIGRRPARSRGRTGVLVGPARSSSGQAGVWFGPIEPAETHLRHHFPRERGITSQARPRRRGSNRGASPGLEPVVASAHRVRAPGGPGHPGDPRRQTCLLTSEHDIRCGRRRDGCGRYLGTISFFTIQSNILAGVVAFQLARNPDRDGSRWRVLRLDALLGITVTGIVYATVLARIHEPKGWEQVTTNALFHYVTPVAAVIGWIAFGPRPRITRTTLAAALCWPAAWFAYTLGRGAVDSWYPYPFVDVVTHGYGRVIANGVLVTVVLGLAGLLYRAGDRWLPRST
jgi:hypothetical protein